SVLSKHFVLARRMRRQYNFSCSFCLSCRTSCNDESYKTCVAKFQYGTDSYYDCFIKNFHVCSAVMPLGIGLSCDEACNCYGTGGPTQPSCDWNSLHPGHQFDLPGSDQEVLFGDDWKTAL